MGKIEYDVVIPMQQRRDSIYLQDMQEFLASTHENAKITYEDAKKAMNARVSFDRVKRVKKIDNLAIKRIDNAVYLIKESMDGK